MNMFMKVWKERKQPFLAFDILFSVITVVMAIMVMINPASSLNMACMLFSLGLVFVTKAIEMIVTKKREYFVLTVISSVFIMVSASLSLWNVFH